MKQGATLHRPTGILYRESFSHNLLGTHVEMAVLGDLLRSKLPKLGVHLMRLGVDISIIATDYFLCLFCTVLPSETAMRIWDALLNEGAKVLYRVALALLKVRQPRPTSREVGHPHADAVQGDTVGGPLYTSYSRHVDLRRLTLSH